MNPIFLCRLLIFSIFGFCGSGACEPASSEDEALWAAVLAEFVDENGLVDYAGLKKKPDALNTFVEGLSTRGPSSTPQVLLTEAQRLAFWLNGYNAFVLYGIKEVYPVASVTEILPGFGFFKQKKFNIDGRDLTLDEIEHTILRPQFKDPRIHAAINCAAKSCPKLSNTPFNSKDLEDQLQDGMQRLIQSSRHVRLDSNTKTLYLSQIFNWFQSDFTDWPTKEQSEIDFTYFDYLARFLPEDQRQFLKATSELNVVYLEYDWSLNDQSVRK